ncbi:ATP-binding protein [Actinoplanes sp. NPDC051494]|uniref:ATP-binding protein n=1 Tax=Actinoplanes sp. NPDC051494 TaxID=3363907 RepID=UPI0037B4BE97
MLLRLRILGRLGIRRDGVDLDPGPRQQACLLALLLARAGEPIGIPELIDLLWGDDAPASARNVIHKYIGSLRRILEPGLPARAIGSHLHRSGPGYVFSAGPGTLDLITFRELTAGAATAAAQGRHDEAIDRYAEALELWRGPAGAGPAHRPAAAPVFAALDSEFLAACCTAAALAVTHRRPGTVLRPLATAVAMAPLHEPVHVALIDALLAAGHRDEALSAYETVRDRLDGDLGIAPGPALRAAHRAILAPRPGAASTTGLVGRVAELAVLHRATELAITGGTGLGIVEGEPGVGKTRLLDEATTQAARRGAFVVRSSCLDGDATPSMWPWERAISTLLDRLPAAARESWLGGELGRLVEPHDPYATTPSMPDNGTQFRMFEQVVALLGQAAALQPVVLVIDDLQWADDTSLHLFAHVARRLPAGTVILGALRDRAPAPGTELSRTLAAASRVPGHHRVRLDRLDPAEVAELVRHETGHDPGSPAVLGIHARTAGNPFFVRELSRLLAAGGELTEQSVARAGVPSSVRDVVLDRMSGLDGCATRLVQVAALIGRGAGLRLLAHATGAGIPDCLERLERLEGLGLLVPAPDDPFTVGFAHDLVREAVTGTMPAHRVGGLHLSIADALDRTETDDESLAERLAHHLVAAGPLADPARTADALMRAGRRAATRSAFDGARRHLLSAVHLARTAGLAELELTALSLLVTVVRRRTGYGGSTVEILERAESLARDLGREAEAADFLFSRFVGASHTYQPDRGQLAHQLVSAGKTSTDPDVRRYGLLAGAPRRWDRGDIAEAYRLLGTNGPIIAGREENPLRHDLLMLWPVWQATLAALHGDLDTSRTLLDAIEISAADDPYAISIWAHYASMVASMAGDPAWALRAVHRWLAANPEHFFIQVDYLRQSWCWARALTGDDPAGAAAEAERLLAATLLDPPRWAVAFHLALIAEMWLAADRPDRAGAALAAAERALDEHGQRYAEGLLPLVRARLLAARGEAPAAVRTAAELARARSAARGAHLFADRAERFLSGSAAVSPL